LAAELKTEADNILSAKSSWPRELKARTTLH